MPRLVHLASGAAALLFARVASAQAPEPTPPTPPPLAQVKDDKQLTEILSQITNDPAVPTDDPNVRPLAQALMIEGVKQLQAKSYDQALANFLEAYAKFPSPKILLNVASTLRDMGRLADAANTYQRYLLDPQTGAERVAEVKELLIRLDEQLTILTVRVFPRGSDVSIDGGPFIPVGATLQTRVRPGIHLVRVKKSETGNELTVNGFEGENKEVAATVAMDVVDDPGKPPTPTNPTPPNPTVREAPKPDPPEQVQGWLVNGTQYGGDGVSRERIVRQGFSGPAISPIVPAFEIGADNNAIIKTEDRFGITSGVLGVLRVDGEGRGFAGGVGLAVSLGRFEGDLMYLRSNLNGGYLGARYRFMVGWLRPYAAVGMPLFLYDEMDDSGGTSKRVALGVRAAGGVELKINGHLSVHGDVGYERFFAVEKTLFFTNYFIPTVGVIGRL